jgi:DNA-binding NarL/FixJ family response regulator
VVMTTFDTDEHILETMRSGAVGFILKGAGPDEIRSAVQAAGAGGVYLSHAVAVKLVRIASRAMSAVTDGMLAKLTRLGERERKILALVGAGMSNSSIAAKTHLSEASVKTYVSRILSRLGLQNRTQAAILAHQSGLLISYPPEAINSV